MWNHDVRMYLMGRRAVAKFFALQDQAFAGLLSCGKVAYYLEIIRISFNFVYSNNICIEQLMNRSF